LDEVELEQDVQEVLVIPDLPIDLKKE